MNDQWAIKGESIFRRRHPLAENTLRRIENGIRRYWGQWAEPFLVKLRGTRDRQLAASAIALVEPLILPYHGTAVCAGAFLFRCAILCRASSLSPCCCITFSNVACLGTLLGTLPHIHAGNCISSKQEVASSILARTTKLFLNYC